MGALGQDIFRCDVSCQTHFFRGGGVEGGGSEAPFGGGPFGGGEGGWVGGGGGASLPCHKCGPDYT